MHADKYQPHTWFYAMSHDLLKNDVKIPNETAVFVYKEDEAFFFEGMMNLFWFFMEFCSTLFETLPHPRISSLL